MKTKPNSQRIRNLIAILCFSLMAIPAQAVTVISSGHADVFEAEYERVGTNAPTLHLGVHTDNGHFEPADVILEVGAAALTTTVGFSSQIINLIGESGYILPLDLDIAVNLGLLEAGVGNAGFPLNSTVTFSMVAAGADNPGNFALFTSSSSIRLSTTGSTVGVSSFSTASSHVHYNWGFSAPGTYTFDLKASYTDAEFGLLESSTETYTFNVIPEPSSGTLLLVGVTIGSMLRRRVLK